MTSPLPCRVLCLDRLIGLQGQLVAQSEEVKRRYQWPLMNVACLEIAMGFCKFSCDLLHGILVWVSLF